MKRASGVYVKEPRLRVDGLPVNDYHDPLGCIVASLGAYRTMDYVDVAI